MLIDTVDPDLQVSRSLLIWMSIVIGIIVALVVYMVARAHRGKPAIGHEHLVGTTGVVRQENMVYIDGALWRIDGDEKFEIGTRVEVTGVDGLRLKVKKRVSE